jgi:putative phosphoribosyl transferase
MYPDRRAAGVALAERIGGAGGGHRIVLALPRGGVPVAAEVARALRLPLDLVLVRKIGCPGEPDLALAALAGPAGEVLVTNEEIRAQAGLDAGDVERLAAPERAELARRRALWLGARPAPELAGATVILVDDGAATGATMRAAVRAVRAMGALRVVAAVPVGSAEALATLWQEADKVVCPLVPRPFRAVGAHYALFPQVGDDEVRDILSGFARAAAS